MRSLIIICTLSVAAGCVTTPQVAPREYLDERTAATITAVAQPWIFTRRDAPPQLDFLHLYAIDVNRMGDHRKYLVAVKYWPDPQSSNEGRPVLELRGTDTQVQLNPLREDPRQLGVGEPIDRAAPRSAQYWFYPLEKDNLEAITLSADLEVAVVTKNTRAEYTVWRDGSAELSEFASVAQDW